MRGQADRVFEDPETLVMSGQLLVPQLLAAGPDAGRSTGPGLGWTRIPVFLLGFRGRCVGRVSR